MKSEGGYSPFTPKGSLSLSETGPVRSINADHLKIDDALGFYALADGVGSTPASAEASRFAVEEAHRCYRMMLEEEDGGRCDLAELILRVSQAFRQHFAGPSIPSTTLTVVSLRDHLIRYASVGDSPVLLIFDGETFLLTRDHTVADRGRPEPVYDKLKSRAASNMLFTAIGPYTPQTTTYPAIRWVPGARLVIGSDGLFEVVSQAELGEIARNARSIGAFRQTLRRRGAQGAPRDNYSAILIDVPVNGVMR